MRLPDDPFGHFDAVDLVALWEGERADRPPYRGLALSSISANAAVQFARRVRQDPDVLDWLPEHVSGQDLAVEEIPTALRPTIRQAQHAMFHIARLGQFSETPPTWMTVDPRRDLRRAGFLSIGDDVAFLLAVRNGYSWIARSVVTRNGLEDPRFADRCRQRRMRCYLGHLEAQHQPRHDDRGRPYSRDRSTTLRLLAETHA